MSTGTGPIGRDPAQRLARNELSKGIYHQTSVPAEVWHAITGFFGRIFHGAGEVMPGGWWTLVALAALVVAAIAVVAVRLGPIARSGRREDSPTRDARPMNSRRFREAAQAAAGAGDYATAILQRLRAVAAACEERGVLGPDAGRTADEFAALAGTRYPGHGAELATAAILFDQVRYGDSPGTQAGYERLRDLDDTLSETTPAVMAGAAAALSTGGPAL